MHRRSAIWITVVVTIIIAALGSPAPRVALAQTSTLPPGGVAEWAVPDLVGYVSFSVPAWTRNCDPEPSIVWNDPSSPFRWLAWRFTQLVNDILCFLLNLAQFFANLFATGLNLIAYAINGIWRFFISTWLMTRDAFYRLWALFEAMRDAFGAMIGWLAAIGAFLGAIWDFIVVALGLVGDLMLLLLRFAGILLGSVGWMVGLLFGPLGAILSALTGVTSPVQMTADSNPIYEAVRGLGEALVASSFGWLLYLSWALAWIGFVYWAAKFMSSAAGGTQE